MKNIIYILLICILIQSCFVNKPIIITQFYPYNKLIDTVISLDKERIYYDNFFLISPYKESKEVENKIDSFVIEYTSSKSYPYNTEEIRLYFYKETKKTNLKAIKQNPREIDRYSNEHDLIFMYIIDNKGNTVRTKYKNGVEVDVKPKQVDKPNFILEKKE